jgi:hypothetical protein
MQLYLLKENFQFFYLLIFSYYTRVPLNSVWRTTDGTRTVFRETLIQFSARY